MNICHITVLVCWYIVDFHFFIFQQRVHQFHPVSPSFAQFHQRIQVADIWAQLDNKVFLETPVKYDTKRIFLKNGFGINVCGGFAQQLRHFHADNYKKLPQVRWLNPFERCLKWVIIMCCPHDILSNPLLVSSTPSTTICLRTFREIQWNHHVPKTEIRINHNKSPLNQT